MGTQPERTHGIQTQTQPNPYPNFGPGPGIGNRARTEKLFVYKHISFSLFGSLCLTVFQVQYVHTKFETFLKTL